jgi:predicted nucleic acid-binding Zn ribbon protein
MIKFCRNSYPDKDGVVKNQKDQYTFVYECICEFNRVYTENKNRMSANKRQCIFCGKSLSGRSDKKYCNDQCRTNFSNDLKMKENLDIRTISLALKKNRNILRKFIGVKDANLVTEDLLRNSGFRFDYHTHYFTSELQKNVFTFCYDYGYRNIGNKKYKIIRTWRNGINSEY